MLRFPLPPQAKAQRDAFLTGGGADPAAAAAAAAAAAGQQQQQQQQQLQGLPGLQLPPGLASQLGLPGALALGGAGMGGMGMGAMGPGAGGVGAPGAMDPNLQLLQLLLSGGGLAG